MCFPSIEFCAALLAAHRGYLCSRQAAVRTVQILAVLSLARALEWRKVVRHFFCILIFFPTKGNPKRPSLLGRENEKFLPLPFLIGSSRMDFFILSIFFYFLSLSLTLLLQRWMSGWIKVNQQTARSWAIKGWGSRPCGSPRRGPPRTRRGRSARWHSNNNATQAKGDW